MKPRFFSDFFRYRKLQFDISTIFLLLLLLYSIITLWYTYRQNEQMVFDFSQSLMSQVSKEVVGHIDTLTNKMVALAQVEKNLIKKPSDVSIENEDLLAFLMNVMIVNPNITILHVGNEQGDWLGVFQVSSNFTYTFTKSAPKDYRFAIQFVNRSAKVPMETWIFKNKEGETLGGINNKELFYDPRQRPWYIGAKENKKPFWTPVYIFAFTNQPGVTVGFPIYDAEGKLIAVSGGDIEIQSLTDFLSKLKISEGARAFILNEEGQAIAGPKVVTSEQSLTSTPELSPIKKVDPIVAKAYQLYLSNEYPSFLFDKDGVKYIASFTPYKLGSDREWLIAFVAPANVFLADVIRIQNNLYMISLITLLVAIFLITFFSKRIARPIVLLSKEVDKVRHLDLEGDINVKTSVREVYLMKEAISAMKSAMRSFIHFIPKEIVQGLLKQGKEIELGGERKQITLFFSDIYNFTSISENNPAEKVLEQLSIYFEMLSKTILEHKGTVDKYLGDGIMAFWGAPTPVESSSLHACRAALVGQHKLSILNNEWEKSGMPVLKTRMGIHEGNAIVGIIGTPQRMNYTAMGDAVNLTARLETVNKTYQTEIIISDSVRKEIGSKFLARPLDIVALKGKSEKIKFYELMGEFDSALKPTDEQIDLCHKFEKAFDAFHSGDRETAKSLFTKLHEEYPQDYPTTFYIERLAQKIEN